jgi:hypothetical protein
MEMRIKNVPLALVSLCFLFAFWLMACQKGSAPTGTPNAQTREKKRLSPERVDIRGSIIRSRYNQGQVMLEVEGTPSQNSRYQRAYVLVLPTTQIVGREGTSISLSELQQGQNVAVLLRSGGQGNLEGIGIARMIWVEEIY